MREKLESKIELIKKSVMRLKKHLDKVYNLNNVTIVIDVENTKSWNECAALVSMKLKMFEKDDLLIKTLVAMLEKQHKLFHLTKERVEFTFTNIIGALEYLVGHIEELVVENKTLEKDMEARDMDLRKKDTELMLMKEKFREVHDLIGYGQLDSATIIIRKVIGMEEPAPPEKQESKLVGKKK